VHEEGKGVAHEKHQVTTRNTTTLTSKKQRSQFLPASRLRQRLKTGVRHALSQVCISLNLLVSRERKRETRRREGTLQERGTTRRRYQEERAKPKTEGKKSDKEKQRARRKRH